MSETGSYDPVTFGGVTDDWMQCPDCQGTGSEFTRMGLDDLMEWCRTCNGSGMVYDGEDDEDEA